MLFEARKDLKGLDFLQLALRKGFTVYVSKSLCPCHERLQHINKKKKKIHFNNALHFYNARDTIKIQYIEIKIDFTSCKIKIKTL